MLKNSSSQIFKSRFQQQSTSLSNILSFIIPVKQDGSNKLYWVFECSGGLLFIWWHISAIITLVLPSSSSLWGILAVNVRWKFKMTNQLESDFSVFHRNFPLSSLLRLNAAFWRLEFLTAKRLKKELPKSLRLIYLLLNRKRCAFYSRVNLSQDTPRSISRPWASGRDW